MTEEERNAQLMSWEYLNDAVRDLQRIVTDCRLTVCHQGASTEIYRLENMKSALFSDEEFQKYSTMKGIIYFLRKFIENTKMETFRLNYGIAQDTIIKVVKNEINRLTDEYTK